MVTLKPVRDLSAWVLQGWLMLAGCTGSPSEQARKLQQAQTSWEATLRLTTELRQHGLVPERYARQTVAAAREELEKIRRKREQLSQ